MITFAFVNDKLEVMVAEDDAGRGLNHHKFPMWIIHSTDVLDD